MHIADALLSPAVGTTLWAGTAVVGGYASKKLKEWIDDRMILLMGVIGAFIFAAQMISGGAALAKSSGVDERLIKTTANRKDTGLRKMIIRQPSYPDFDFCLFSLDIL